MDSEESGACAGCDNVRGERQPRRARNRWGKNFCAFLPAMSTKAAKHVRRTIREWRLASTKNHYALEDLPRLVDPVVRGWMNY